MGESCSRFPSRAALTGAPETAETPKSAKTAEAPKARNRDAGAKPGHPTRGPSGGTSERRQRHPVRRRRRWRGQDPPHRHQRGNAVELHRLRDVRHRGPSPAGGARRPEARPPPRPLRHVRQRLPPRTWLREVRQARLGHHGQLPPARRRLDLRHHGPHGPAVVHALPARRRPGQLRFPRRRRPGGHAIHRGPPHVAGHGDGPRHPREHRRLPAQLRRPHHRARHPAVAHPPAADERFRRHRRRHGHQHPAAQPARNRRGHQLVPGQPGGRRQDRPRGDHGLHQGPRLPDRRPDRRRQGHRGGLHHRPRLDPHARRHHHRAGGHPAADRHHRTAVPGQPGPPHRQHRRAGPRRPPGRHLLHRRRVRPQVGHAHRRQAQARRRAARGAEQPVQALAAADQLRRQHAVHRRRRAAHPAHRPDGPALRRPPDRSHRPPHPVPPGRGRKARPHPPRPGQGAGCARRGHRPDPPVGDRRHRAHRPDGAARHRRGAGRRHPGHAAAPPGRPRAPEDHRRARRAGEQDRRPQGHPGQPAAPARHRPRRARRGRGEVRRRPPHPDHRRHRRRHRGRPHRPRERRRDHHVDRLRQAHQGRRLQVAAPRRQGRARGGPEAGRHHPPLLRLLHPRLDPVLHQPRPRLPPQGLRAARGHPRRPRPARGQPAGVPARRAHRRGAADPDLPGLPVPGAGHARRQGEEVPPGGVRLRPQRRPDRHQLEGRRLADRRPPVLRRRRPAAHLRARPGHPLHRLRRRAAPDGPRHRRRAGHALQGRRQAAEHGRRGGGSAPAGRHHRRLRQEDAAERVRGAGPRRPGRADPEVRPEARRDHGRAGGVQRRRDLRRHLRRRHHPHPRQRDPRDVARHQGRAPGQPGRRHRAAGH